MRTRPRRSRRREWRRRGRGRRLQPPSAEVGSACSVLLLESVPFVSRRFHSANANAPATVAVSRRRYQMHVRGGLTAHFPVARNRVTAGFVGEQASGRGLRGRSLRTAMKEGLLGGKLRLSSRTDLEEARLHVARWTRSKSKEA